MVLKKIKFIVWLLIWWGIFQGITVLREHNSNIVFHSIVRGIICTAVICIVGMLLKVLLSGRLKCRRLSGISNEMPDYFFVLLVMFFLLLAWLPAFLALYPGNYSYDSPEQIAQYVGQKSWSLHHPVLSTWLIGKIFSLGKSIFGNDNAGIALYCAFQAVVVSFCEARAFLFMKRKKVHVLIIVVGLVWLAVNPITTVLHFSMTKDVLFGAFLLYFVVVFLEQLTQKEERKKENFNVFLLIVIGIITCLLRNQGIYVIFAAGILMILIYRRKVFGKELRKIMLALLIIIVLTEGAQTFFVNGLGMKKGNLREMFSVPMQQLALVAKEDIIGEKDLITDEELNEIEEIIPLDGIMAYQYDTADPVKTTFKTDAFMGNPAKYIYLYLKIGVKNPVVYVYAFGDMIVPYWDMNQNPYRILTFTYVFPDYVRGTNINRESKFPAYFELLTNSIMDEKLFICSPWKYVFNPSYSLWLLIAVVGETLIYRKKELFFGTLFFVLYFLTCLLGPVALLRYMYPLMLAEPFILGLAFQNSKENDASFF